MEFAVLVLHLNILFSNKTQYVQKTGVEPVTFSSQILTLYQWAILATYEDLLYESLSTMRDSNPPRLLGRQKY